MKTRLAGCCLVLLLAGEVRAEADEPIRTAMMPTEAAGRDLVPVGRAFHAAIRSELGRVDTVVLSEPPKVTYEDLQLAVGCLENTLECQLAIASQLGVDALLMSAVAPAGNKNTASIVFVDTRESGSKKRVERRFGGADLEQKIAAAVPAMVDELFGIESQPPDVSAEPAPTEARADTKRSFPWVSVTTGIIAVGLIGAGAGLRVSANNEPDALSFQNGTITPVGGGTQLQLTPTKSETAQRKEAISTALFAVGGATAVAAIVLGLTVDKRRNERRASVMPVVGPRFAGASFAGTLGASQ